MEDKFESEFINEGGYPINTGEIYQNELNHWIAPEDSSLTSYPTHVADALIFIIQHLLVEYSHPSQSHSKDENYNKYLHEKKRAVYSGPLFNDKNPFKPDYFVLGLNKPREQYDKPVFQMNGPYCYMYELSHPLCVPRSAVKPDQFELLFAFSLRQCNLSRLNDFLDYHLEKSFNTDLAAFVKYVVLIKRKFETILFNKGHIEAIGEWVILNEKASTKTKIKCVLTVDQLAYLFRALQDNKLIGDENNSTIFNKVSESFESKTQSQISKKNLGNKFYTPTLEAIEFWADQFEKLSKLAIREGQKKSI